jgi:DNA-binding MarR family transcriptional regulator
MQRRKLLTRKRARNDARVVMVSLTERGHDLTERLVPAATDLETRLVGELDASEIALLKRTLDKLYGNISRSAGDAAEDVRSA